VLGEFRAYGQLTNGEASTLRDVFTFNVGITASYMMENYYKDPARYQKNVHFTHPQLFEDNKYNFGMREWVNTINGILAGFIEEGMSEKEKVKAVHDYLILNTTYYSLNEDDKAHIAHTVFREHRGVCDAYAEAFKILMNALGIECIVVPGEAADGGHAWNQVKVDGKWYNIDVTWDDPDDGDQIYYDYFCIPDSKMYKDHTVDEGFVPYICDSPALDPRK
jgi:transglutaminase/protease-like cytokinesis protein 3